MRDAAHFVHIHGDREPVRIEYQWIESKYANAPLVVFLHEGLGSRSMWKDFPRRLCVQAGCRGLVYSRPGYGGSTPRKEDETWEPDYMHRQAYSVLPTLLAALDVDPEVTPPWLFGHSDGASIALLYAARFPSRAAGVIALAPHILVEDLSLVSIEAARQAYLHTNLRQRLAKFHDDPDSAFWGWNRIWLHPAFRDWSIEQDIAAIGCPVLAIQGLDDAYGTMKQIRGIARHVLQTELLELPDCGHAVHQDQPDRVIAAVTKFICHHTLAPNRSERIT